MKVNKLSLNYTKTNYMIFTRKKEKFDFNLKLDGFTLERVASTKYLGVIIDEKLNWSLHIKHIHRKLSRSSYILSKLRHYVNLDTLKTLYYSLIYPHITYCISTWGGASIKPLVTLQKKIVRIIT